MPTRLESLHSKGLRTRRTSIAGNLRRVRRRASRSDRELSGTTDGRRANSRIQSHQPHVDPSGFAPESEFGTHGSSARSGRPPSVSYSRPRVRDHRTRRRAITASRTDNLLRVRWLSSQIRNCLATRPHPRCSHPASRLDGNLHPGGAGVMPPIVRRARRHGLPELRKRQGMGSFQYWPPRRCGLDHGLGSSNPVEGATVSA